MWFVIVLLSGNENCFIVHCRTTESALVICCANLCEFYLEMGSVFHMTVGSLHITQLSQRNITWVEILGNQWWVRMCMCGLHCTKNHRLAYYHFSSLLFPWIWTLWLEVLETCDLPPPALSPWFWCWYWVWASEELCWPTQNYCNKVCSSWHPGCGRENEGLSMTPLWGEKGTMRRKDTQALQIIPSYISLSQFKGKQVGIQKDAMNSE